MYNMFSEALRNDSLEMMRAVPKSDIHNHASRGGNIKYLSRVLGTTIHPPTQPFANLAQMQEWFQWNIKRNCNGMVGYLRCLEAAFIQAKADNICVLAMSFGIYGIDTLGGIDNFVNVLNILHQRYAPQIDFRPELSIRRESAPDNILYRLDEILDKNWFQSIDICGYEQSQPIACFQPVYRKAKQHGLKLKAHVGEFGTADDVMGAVELLELSEVHHGIAVARSKQIMRWLADHLIQLNICPTSNIMMGLVSSYADHPIKTIVGYGIPVTINTDDMLIFNQSVSEEYLNLYRSGAMSIAELEVARQRGIMS